MLKTLNTVNCRAAAAGLISALVAISILHPMATVAFAQIEADPNQPLAPLAEFREDFEIPIGGVPEGAAHSWSVVAGEAAVSTETSFAGNSSLKIDASTPAGQVTFNLPTLGNNSVTFVDFRLLAVAASADEAVNTVDAAGAQSGFLRVNSAGKLLAFDAAGEGSWRDTGTQWPLSSGGVVNQWTRLSMRLVPSAGKWDLFADGKLLLVDLGLDSAAQYILVLNGDQQGPIFIDDLYAGAVNPLFIDLNADGLPDGWVSGRTAGAAITGSPRDWQDSTSGASLLSEYLATLAALSSPGALDSHKMVFVHPTLRSFGDLAALLKLLNSAKGANSPEDADPERAFLEGLARDLDHSHAAANAGLSGPAAWQFAGDLATAAQIAPDGAEIVVFPAVGPYVWSSFDSRGKQIVLRALDGVVFSTAETVAEGRALQAQRQTDIQSAVAAKSGTSSAAALTQLWPTVRATSPDSSPTNP